MRSYYLSALFMLGIIGGAQAQHSNHGFVPLFDGKTTQGWHTYGKTFTGKGWKVERDGDKKGQATTKAESAPGPITAFEVFEHVEDQANDGLARMMGEDD